MHVTKINMKRIYSKRKRSKAKEEALETFRKTQKKLKKTHPELLDRIQQQYKLSQLLKNQPQKPAPISDEIIDQHKNIETLMKFLELSESDTMQKHIRKILAHKLN